MPRIFLISVQYFTCHIIVQRILTMLYHQAPTLISWDDVDVGEGAEDMIGDDTIADDKDDEDFVAVRPKARPDVLRPVFQQKGLQWLRALTLPLDRIALSHAKSFYLLAEILKEGGLDLDDVTLSKETLRTMRLEERSKWMTLIKVRDG